LTAAATGGGAELEGTDVVDGQAIEVSVHGPQAAVEVEPEGPILRIGGVHQRRAGVEVKVPGEGAGGEEPRGQVAVSPSAPEPLTACPVAKQVSPRQSASPTLSKLLKETSGFWPPPATRMAAPSMA
jgi:hypothetical protein